MPETRLTREKEAAHSLIFRIATTAFTAPPFRVRRTILEESFRDSVCLNGYFFVGVSEGLENPNPNFQATQ
jgi:hypothetical protein